ncbi:hypothetical protein DEU56DRAFT_837623, partial [Suillus clintonianus]|uniref:uncharacterized protein n=1 Tax=Suillus clintonianus TaxID=1904413 RepID=UPI001B875350
ALGQPAGLVAALTFLQNSIPSPHIDQEPNPRIGHRGSQNMSLSSHHFSDAPYSH